MATLALILRLICLLNKISHKAHHLIYVHTIVTKEM